MLEAFVAEALIRNDRHIAITGASGWIGLATLDLLMCTFGDTFANRVTCYGSSARMLDLGEGRVVEQRALSELAMLGAKHVWVLHFAFQTKDRAEAMGAEAYRAANRAIANTVLAALDRIDTEALFVASSGAAARADDPGASPAMRLYGAMKRDDETRFAAWAESHCKRAVIGRIFAITGPYINKHESYAIASLIRDALARRPILVRAPHEVYRGYVAIRELMSLVFALLDEPGSGVVRFESGGEALELAEVAQIVAVALGGGTVDRAAVTDPRPDRYIGDAATYATLLKKHGIQPVPLDRQVRETAKQLAVAG